MNDVFELANWVSSSELAQISKIALGWKPVEFRPNYGRFPNELIARQRWHTWDDHDELGNILKSRMNQVLGEDLKVVEVDYVELYLPWDIHSEAHREEKGSATWYTFIIPMEDYDSRTIIFDQTAQEYNDFYKYKNTHDRCNDPINLEFWQDNLSHCWDEDREYLSVKFVSSPWSAGNTLFFKRELFHSSDNFHDKKIGPKHFLQILTDIK